jgi:acyl-CoA synthetase (AMP-forming)/AMP-acid ligase II
MPPERIAVADAAFGGRLVQFYGMVEAIPPVTVLSQDDHRRAIEGGRPEILGSAGRACMGVELEVVGEDGEPRPDGEHGELVVSGDHPMAGYWGMADESGKALRDGRLWTGDMAWRDDEGYVTIIDRKNDMIITGGYNVYPREVEDVIAGDPAVSAVAVVGVADADWGEAVTAVVVAKPGATLDLADLDTRCRQLLAPFKRPKRIEPVDALPITSAGKINRKAVRATLEEAGDGR